MTDFQAQHEENRARFVIVVEEEEAFVEYRRPDERTLDLVHTLTPPAARGKGIAGVLVRTALEYAREHGLRVIPTCSYVASYLERHPEYASLADRGS